jgi:hypothetical protein
MTLSLEARVNKYGHEFYDVSRHCTLTNNEPGYKGRGNWRWLMGRMLYTGDTVMVVYTYLLLFFSLSMKI